MDCFSVHCRISLVQLDCEKNAPKLPLHSLYILQCQQSPSCMFTCKAACAASNYNVGVIGNVLPMSV